MGETCKSDIQRKTGTHKAWTGDKNFISVNLDNDNIEKAETISSAPGK